MRFHRPSSLRSTVLLVVGIAGVTAETVYSLKYRQSPDSTLTLGFLAMAGVPLAFGADSKDNDDDDRRPQEPPTRTEPPTPGPGGT